jgi:hypothetical protein
VSEPRSGVKVEPVGVEIGRPAVVLGVWRRLTRAWTRRRTPSRPPAWHAPHPEIEGIGRHHRGDGGYEVTRTLRDGTQMQHYSHAARDATLTIMFRPAPTEDLVPFREPDCA